MAFQVVAIAMLLMASLADGSNVHSATDLKASFAALPADQQEVLGKMIGGASGGGPSEDGAVAVAAVIDALFEYADKAAVVPAALAAAQVRADPPLCPAGWVPHAPGLWSNPSPCGRSYKHCTEDTVNVTVELCARKCALTKGCLAFELYQPAPKACFTFINTLQLPFIPDPDCFACVSNHSGPVPPPPLPPPPPSPPPPHPTSGHTFPRLGNCWGPDPYITDKMWRYLGYPNVTNATWGNYDVVYLNPFDSCCWKQEMDSWVR
eukprot:gene16038-4568_t